MAFAALGCGEPDVSPPEASQTQSSPPSEAPDSVDDGAGEGGSGQVPVLVDVEIPPRPAATPIPAPAPEAAGECPKRKAKDVGIIISPRRPVSGRRVNVLASSLQREGALALRIETETGEVVPVETVHRGGLPISTVARFDVPSSGTFVVTVGQDGEGLRCAKFWAQQHGPKRTLPEPNLAQVWETKRAWDAANEALYSAWVRELFHAPAGESLAFSALDELTSDADRNLLYDYYGWREDHDSKGLTLNPDCADTPYFLRGYFAWKRGLPFGFRTCSRGRGAAPQCYDLRTTGAPPNLKETWVDESEPFDHLMVIDRYFRRTLAWGVHTGNGRTAYGDSATDLYPVELDRKGLRPGIVYADPYGHIFVLVGVVEQEGDFPGILYAIDGQPDGSITRKRFWEGNFLWNPDPSLGGSGFKAFRPLVKVVDDQGVENLLPLDDAALSRRKDYADVSEGQSKLTRDEFYDQVERLISPGPRDPLIAQAEAVVALAEAARVRVTSVDNGLKWQAEHPGEVIEMPWGHDVFETVGPWENYSTPARDLRLLIAMDVVANFERKVERQPDAYGLGGGAGLEDALARVRAFRQQLLADPRYAITYTGSDGATVTLNLAQLFERSDALQVAYNPNDCPEVRWGAPDGSDEAKPCGKRAPEDQVKKMEAYRAWFAKRQRPPRGDLGPDVPGVPRAEELPAD
jgi:hypothetical protein